MIRNQISHHSENTKRLRREVVINSLIDIVLLVVVFYLGSNDNWLAHALRIFFITRIADYSSYRQGRPWSIFNVAIPHTDAQLNPEHDLILFSGYRVLSRIWFVAGMLTIICVLWIPLFNGDLLMVTRVHFAILIWALLVLSCHLPKRMLLWRCSPSPAGSPLSRLNG